jgi:hypothetical protein
MTIIEALKTIRDAALEGRKLEAWCEEEPDILWGYSVNDNRWTWRLDPKTALLTHDCTHEFSILEILSTWYTREVKNDH